MNGSEGTQGSSFTDPQTWYARLPTVSAKGMIEPEFRPSASAPGA